ncbi:HNH endonuclease [Psychromonas marina]|nr:HNH endonuclease signature motif containing protein [Psychromonas marina]
MNESYSYIRPQSVNGEKPEYTFYQMDDAVKVVRKTNKIRFEHIFKKGDLVQGRTLKTFGFLAGYKEKRSVYATSEEFPESNAQSLANQIDFIYENEISSAIEYDLAEIILDSTTTATDKECLVKARIGQGVFRRNLFIMWGGCAVTGVTTKELLIASHIQPWSKSNGNERLDVFNGFLLIANIDKAFDSGLITFASTGEIIISPLFNDYHMAGISTDMKLKLQPEHGKYLKYHREFVYKNT